MFINLSIHFVIVGNAGAHLKLEKRILVAMMRPKNFNIFQKINQELRYRIRPIKFFLEKSAKVNFKHYLVSFFQNATITTKHIEQNRTNFT